MTLETPYIILFIVLGLIVFCLSLYLGKIFVQINYQKKVREDYQKAMDKVRDEKLNDNLESMRIIALAVSQGQCEVSEGVIRMKKLLDLTPYKDDPRFSSFTDLYQKFDQFAYLEARESLTKQEKFRQDSQRFKLEEQTKDEFKALCSTFLDFLKEKAHHEGELLH